MTPARIILASLLVLLPGCKSDEKERARPVKAKSGSDAPGDGWRVKMSNDLLQQWILACGGATGEPRGDAGVITIFLGDDAQGTNCTFRYTQSTMEIQDVQLAVTDADPTRADAKFLEFVDDIVKPLVSPMVADRVRADAVSRESYVSKRVGPFTLAMRSESDAAQTTRWLWVFQGATPAAAPARPPGS